MIRVNFEVNGPNFVTIEERAKALLAMLNGDHDWYIDYVVRPELVTAEGTVNYWTAEVEATRG